MPENAKKEFIELVKKLNKSKGLDDLTSHIIGILFIEPVEISLEELSERTGYSLSAVSTSMKIMSGSPMIKRIKKPGSRKVYFFMEKDMTQIIHQSMKSVMGNVLVMKDKLPLLIERYKKENGPADERRILENHYIMVKKMEAMMGKFAEMMKEIHSVNNKKK
ncbi:MAG: hypothetical protein JW789_05190 [Candidatus Aenigmarchaeota archaeon]|nr:hypothetical protein [Candidatus Aenigmarchaeota archaeon]